VILVGVVLVGMAREAREARDVRRAGPRLGLERREGARCLVAPFARAAAGSPAAGRHHLDVCGGGRLCLARGGRAYPSRFLAGPLRAQV